MWNSTQLLNKLKGKEQKTNFNFHKKQIESIKAQNSNRIDNSEPIYPKFLYQKSIINSRPYQNQQRQIQLDNKNLVQKMMFINKNNSLKKVFDKYVISPQKNHLYKFQMSLNIENRIQNLRQVINENELIEQRLKKAQPTVNYYTLKHDYALNTKYKQQMLTNSNRTYNCMLESERKSLMKSNSELSSTMHNKPFSQPFTKTRINKRKKLKSLKKISSKQNF